MKRFAAIGNIAVAPTVDDAEVAACLCAEEVDMHFDRASIVLVRAARVRGRL
jgi:hypothetical protein